MKIELKYIISIIFCILFLTSCGDYDFILENQCKLTGKHEVRTVDTSYMIYVGDVPIWFPDSSEVTYYEYSCVNDNVFWSREQVIAKPTEND
jgi:hypothetical protein